MTPQPEFKDVAIHILFRFCPSLNAQVQPPEVGKGVEGGRGREGKASLVVVVVVVAAAAVCYRRARAGPARVPFSWPCCTACLPALPQGWRSCAWASGCERTRRYGGGTLPCSPTSVLYFPVRETCMLLRPAQKHTHGSRRVKWRGFGSVVRVGGCVLKYAPAIFPTPKGREELHMPRVFVVYAYYSIFQAVRMIYQTCLTQRPDVVMNITQKQRKRFGAAPHTRLQCKRR